MELNFENKRVIIDESSQLYIEIYTQVISEEDGTELLQLLTNNAKWRDPFLTKTGKVSSKRNKCIYGSIPYYHAIFRGTPLRSKVHSWEQIPILHDLASVLSSKTNDTYNTCVLQYYANQKVGIQPHRDKEVVGNNVITSLSVGATRIMRFERNGIIHDIELTNGSLCVIYPPTNEKWLHSIVCEKKQLEPRVSLVFRNHLAPLIHPPFI